MDKHPDKYFTKKLIDYRKDPPSGAWDRIDANLGQAKPRRMWLSVAASVILIVVAGFLFFSLNTNPAESIVIQNQEDSNSIVTDDSVTQKPELSEHITLDNTEPEEVTIIADIANGTPDLSKHKQISEKIKSEDIPVEVYSDNVESVAEVIIKKEPEVIEPPAINQKLPSRVITYSAQEVNQKYLRLKKKEAVVYTEPAKEKTTIIEIAIAIKNNQVGLGDLRQIKDDLFSLELFAQNDKTKTQ